MTLFKLDLHKSSSLLRLVSHSLIRLTFSEFSFTNSLSFAIICSFKSNDLTCKSFSFYWQIIHMFDLLSSSFSFSIFFRIFNLTQKVFTFTFKFSLLFPYLADIIPCFLQLTTKHFFFLLNFLQCEQLLFIASHVFFSKFL